MLIKNKEDEEIKDMLAFLSSAYRSVEDVAAIACRNSNQKHCKQTQHFIQAMLSDACEKINSVCTKLEEKLS